MQVNEDKLKRQLLGVDRWRKSKSHGAKVNGCGTFKYPTGMGKTYTALLIVKKIIDNLDKFDNYDYIAHITVPSEFLKLQWEQEVKIHIPDIYQDKVRVIIVNSLLGELNRPKAILSIVDEVHEFYSDERFKVIDGTIIKYKFILCLSATPEDSEKREKRLYKICPIVDEVPLQLAIDKGWISKFTEYNVGIELSENDRIRYDRYSEQITTCLQYFNGDYKLAQSCLSGGISEGIRYNAYSWAETVAATKGWTAADRYHEHHPKAVIQMAVSLNKCVKSRKDLIYKSKQKLEIVNKIVTKFDTLKTICFSQSTDFANELCDNINSNADDEELCVVYHSQLKSRMLPSPKTNKLIKFGVKRLRDRAINRIKTGESRIMSTSSSLDNGFDVKDIRCAITTSGTQNPRQYKQRRGRAVRVEDISDIYDGEVTVLLINIYFRNTVDEKSLKNRQYGETHKILWIYDIDKIEYTPQPVREVIINKQTKMKI